MTLRSAASPRRTSASLRSNASRLTILGVVGTSALAGPPALADEPGPYSGRWAFLQATTTVARIPVIGNVYATTTAVSLHKLKHHGERLRGKGKLCHLAIDSGSALVKTTMPPALVRALPIPRIDGVLREHDGQLAFAQPRQTIVLGARLADPSGGELPQDRSDARVIDQDEDGAPGVTVRVTGLVSGDIHVVQRSWTELTSHRVSHDRIEGAIRFGNEQVILDATSSMLRKAPDATPDFARSRFHLVRVAESSTCMDAIVALGARP